MVVFTCQKCNSTLKKNAVEKHFSCRPFFLTCIDCLKDFKGNEYETHTSCITEAEKYGGGKAIVKPAGVKQKNWAEAALEIIADISKNPRYHKFCDLLQQAPNIPRNRTKFHNFVRCSCSRIYNSKIVDEIFDHLEKVKDNNKNESNSKVAKPNSGSENSIENNENDGNSDKKKKKKKKNKNEVKNPEELDESSAEKNDEIKGKKRPLSESDLHSTEQQNGAEVKKSKREKKMKMKTSLDNPDFSNVVNNHQNKENEEEEVDEPNRKEQTKSLLEETTGEETNGLKLSKKELKKLKKQQKYNAQLAEIESVQPEKDASSLDQEDNAGKKKKKKKMKDEAVENGKECSSELSPKRKPEKDSVIEDIAGKKVKLNDTLKEEDIPIETGKKFKWGQVIKQILENTSDKELSLKKLRKKVMNEYQVQKGDDTPYEKLLGTFNKKVNSTEGVKVFKDKAQLILT